MYGHKTLFEKRRNKCMQLFSEDLNQIALGIAATIRTYCEIEPALEQEYMKTQGWLKVKKLRQITDGLDQKPAQELVYEDYYGKKKQSSQNVD
jgi:hypothetical protein